MIRLFIYLWMDARCVACCASLRLYLLRWIVTGARRPAVYVLLLIGEEDDDGDDEMHG